MPQAPPNVTPEIARGDLSAAQLEIYLRARAVAVDTETMGLNPLRDRLCVVQLCDRDGHATLVQFQQEDLARPMPRAPRLARLLEEASITKVLHFARFDVATLRQHLGIRMAPLYCTRTASKLVRTYTDRHGLKDCVLELLGVELDKTSQRTDWASPDLRPEQVAYAIADVTLLLPLMDKLDAMLAREGRSALARECFQAIPLVAQLDLLGFVSLFEH
jgi:ribonuclease D